MNNPLDRTSYLQLYSNIDREMLLKILHNSFDEIFVTDAEGVILYVNPMCEQHYGVEAKDIVGKNASHLVEQGYCFPPMMPKFFKEMKQTTTEQETNIGKKLLTTATPVFNQNGDLELVVQNSRDITHLNALRNDLVKAHSMLQGYRQEALSYRKKQMLSMGLVAHSEKFKNILEMAHQVAGLDSTITLLGKSGTGKSLLAKYIHTCSRYADGPFVTINCAAIPGSLLESELFGYAEGAFSGARKDGKTGRIAMAEGGTLFLDEISEMNPELQAKLLEVVEDHQFIPLGAESYRKINMRILAATNQDLKKAIKEGRFREDLYYRLTVINLEIPPLNERIQDILPLVYFFLDRFDGVCKTKHQIHPKAINLLQDYSWPGNVRELEHTMEFLTSTVRDHIITEHHLPENFHQLGDFADHSARYGPLDSAVESLTRKFVVNSYKDSGSSYKVARKLNISQTRAYRLIKKFVKK
jgi:PAS domain S-box-containing protein